MIEARDSGASGTTSGRGGKDFWPAEDQAPGKSRKPLFLYGGAALAVLLVLAGAGAFFLTRGGDEPVPRLSPTAYTPEYDGEGTSAIARRSADPRPVTLAEVFGDDVKTVASNGFTYTLAGTDLKTDCKAATWGAALQAQLATSGCRAVVRGAYVSKAQGFVGQFAVLDLADSDGVRQVLRMLDPATGSGFVLPLAAPGAPAFTKGFSAAYAQAYGHYAVVCWVQKSGGGLPKSLDQAVSASLPVEKPAFFVWARVQMADGAGK
ncbi:hypothetical protein BTM25_25700 [Actinomadura rubteroloni]|uniref:Uncharacterized protein n=1 Tax=Actinomadura rubteroloni TaxID=1926885 RepID=A0A2P4UFV6_9ACTN|nr:hypothetical protein [Actinomadura rubteroloni]POM23943.1 hypothetical protein BTM25_25700 [Actinomadura rubteroloni]